MSRAVEVRVLPGEVGQGGHGSTSLADGRPRSAPAALAQTDQAGEIVDRLVEHGNGDQDVGRSGQLGALLGLPRRHDGVVGEALAHLGQHPADAGRRRADARGAPRWPAGPASSQNRPATALGPASSSHSGSALLTITAPRGRPRRWSSSTKKAASWAGAVSRVVTTQNVVRASAMSALTLRARSTKPFSIDCINDEELGDVLEEAGPEHPIGDGEERTRRRADDTVAHRRRQPAQEPSAEELLHALGGVEEVERVAGGWGVDDDQVVAAGRVQLVQPLHGDVVVALDEAGGDVLVERVGEDGVAGAVVGGVAAG